MTFISTPCVDRDHIEPPQPRLNRSERRSRTAWAFASGGTSCSRGRREELLDYVVRINMGVARGVAGGYLNRGIEGEDLVQVAYVALTRAAGNFDPSRHQDFLAYAVPSMRGELKKPLPRPRLGCPTTAPHPGRPRADHSRRGRAGPAVRPVAASVGDRRPSRPRRRRRGRRHVVGGLLHASLAGPAVDQRRRRRWGHGR